MTCTRCEGSGFLNLHQVDEKTLTLFNDKGTPEMILDWIKNNPDCDVSVCDCCGDRTNWYGIRGGHYESPEDPRGKDGPYAYNGGLCECN